MTVREEPTDLKEPAELKGFDDFDLRLGDILRGERATLGKSLLDVQRDLKIKAAYIAAIESSDPSVFETQGFVAGYVRSYARYLGLDPEETYEVFCQESGFQTAHGMSDKASTAQIRAVKERQAKGLGDPFVAPKTPYLPAVAGRFAEFDPRAVLSMGVLAALIAGLGWGGWSLLQEIQRVQVAPVAQSPGVAETVEPLRSFAGLDTGGAADVATPSSEALDRLYQPQALDLPVLVQRDGPIGAVDPSTIGALAGMAVPTSEKAPDMAAVLEPAPDVADTSSSVQVVEDLPLEVAIFAVRPAWVRVQSATGTVLFEKILDAGERYVIPVAEAPAELRAGNSGSIYFDIGGETFGPAGVGASVAKNVSLGVEELQTAYQIADIEADPALQRIIALAEGEDAAGSE